MAMIGIKVTPEVIERVSELRARGLSRAKIAEEIGVSVVHIKYIISRYRIMMKKRIWYRAERTTFTDAMPNPFPKWWCDLHNLDHNFYRPKWKD